MGFASVKLFYITLNHMLFILFTKFVVLQITKRKRMEVWTFVEDFLQGTFTGDEILAIAILVSKWLFSL